jgi:hypothetical protein
MIQGYVSDLSISPEFLLDPEQILEFPEYVQEFYF